MKQYISETGFSSELLLADARALAEKIGPRGTGTQAEAQAAQYVHRRLGKLGCGVDVQRFRAVCDMNWFPISAAIFILMGTLIYPWTGWSKWLAAVFAFCAAPLLWWAITRADSPLWFLLPKVWSQNVLTRFSPKESVKQRVVVLSHLDSNRCRLAWRAGKTKINRNGAIATLFMYALNGGLYFLGAISGFAWPYWASLPGVVFALAMLLILSAEMRRPYSPGANDNAAAVAVNLSLAARLAEEPLGETEVLLAFTGAEEVDHRGLKYLLKRYRELDGAFFLDLEGVGGGELCYLTHQGLLKPYRPDPRLSELAERVATKRPRLGFKPARMLIVDEVQTLRRLGYRALCLAGRDAATGSLPYWHTAADVVENINTDALVRAAEFVWTMVKELDRRAE